MFNFKPVEWWHQRQLERKNMIVQEKEDLAYLCRVCDVKGSDYMATAIHKIVLVLKRLRGEKHD